MRDQEEIRNFEHELQGRVDYIVGMSERVRDVEEHIDRIRGHEAWATTNLETAIRLGDVDAIRKYQGEIVKAQQRNDEAERDLSKYTRDVERNIDQARVFSV